jgi:uncharacterized protein (TIGR02246 family)
MPITDPTELGRVFAERINAGDLEGIVELYEQDAKLVAADGSEAQGHEAIRASLENLLAARPTLTPGEHHTVRATDIALISMRWRMTVGPREQADTTFEGISTEVARRQADGSWLYVIDHPSILPASPSL